MVDPPSPVFLPKNEEGNPIKEKLRSLDTYENRGHGTETPVSREISTSRKEGKTGRLLADLAYGCRKLSHLFEQLLRLVAGSQ